MEIRNETRDLVLSVDAVYAKSFFSRLRGLLFSPPRDLVLVSPREDIPSSSIHMFLMKYPIDVIWVDSSMQVVDLTKSVKPSSFIRPGSWRVYRPKKPAKYVIELGKGSNLATQEGDCVRFLDV